MNKIIQKYGSVGAALDRLNELQSQKAFAYEAGVSEFSVTRFLMLNNVTRITRFVQAGDVRPWVELTRDALNELHGTGA